MVRIESLHVYPLKSAAVINLAESVVTPQGLLHDRNWLIVDGDGQFITQRTEPTLAQLRTAITDTELRLQHPQAGELILPVPSLADAEALPTTPLQKVRVWKRDILAHDNGDTAAEFVSKIVQRPARLVQASKENFPDGYPLLICTVESLLALNEHMSIAIPMNRFRPNLVLSGLAAWEEDRIQSLCINGDIWLRPVKACTRCVMTGIDQSTGKPGASPLSVLKALRYDPVLRGVTFGQNAKVDRGFGRKLRVGDSVEVRLF